MNVGTQTLLLSIGLGLLSSFLRMAIQRNRDDKWPEDLFGTVLELFIGAVAGGVQFLLYVQFEGVPVELVCPMLYLGALGLGYGAPDALENILKQYTPVN